MTFRLLAAAALALPLLAPPGLGPAHAQGAPAAETTAKAAPKASRPLSAGQSAARARQKQCGTEWKALTKEQKTAQGPKWPQFWSTCNKRLKGSDKA